MDHLISFTPQDPSSVCQFLRFLPLYQPFGDNDSCKGLLQVWYEHIVHVTQFFIYFQQLVLLS